MPRARHKPLEQFTRQRIGAPWITIEYTAYPDKITLVMRCSRCHQANVEHPDSVATTLLVSEFFAHAHAPCHEPGNA